MISFEDDFSLFDGFSRAELVDMIRGYRLDCERAEADYEKAQTRIRELEAKVRKYSSLYASWKRAAIAM